MIEVFLGEPPDYIKRALLNDTTNSNQNDQNNQNNGNTNDSTSERNKVWKNPRYLDVWKFTDQYDHTDWDESQTYTCWYDENGNEVNSKDNAVSMMYQPDNGLDTMIVYGYRDYMPGHWEYEDTHEWCDGKWNEWKCYGEITNTIISPGYPTWDDFTETFCNSTEPGWYLCAPQYCVSNNKNAVLLVETDPDVLEGLGFSLAARTWTTTVPAPLS